MHAGQSIFIMHPTAAGAHQFMPAQAGPPTRSFRVASMTGCSSGMTTYCAVQGLPTASWKNCRMAGPLKSSYTPLLARSLTVTTPKMAGSPMLLVLPPERGGLLGCDIGRGLLLAGATGTGPLAAPAAVLASNIAVCCSCLGIGCGKAVAGSC